MDDIIVKNLSKTYGELEVLNNFNCRFKRGKFNIIIGESGIGKTSLLNILMKLEVQDQGEILNMNKDISVIFQENRLLDKFTIYENLEYVVDDLDRKEMDLALERVGLDSLGNEKIYNLSGGMKRRVAILRSVLKKSDLYIFDEAFKDVDDDTYNRLVEYVKEKLEGQTVIMTSHRISELEYFDASLIEMK